VRTVAQCGRGLGADGVEVRGRTATGSVPSPDEGLWHLERRLRWRQASLGCHGASPFVGPRRGSLRSACRPCHSPQGRCVRNDRGTTVRVGTNPWRSLNTRYAHATRRDTYATCPSAGAGRRPPPPAGGGRRHSARTTPNVRGPWTPSTRWSSMSLVATDARRPRIVVVAFPGLRRSCASPSARRAAAGKGSSPRGSHDAYWPILRSRCVIAARSKRSLGWLPSPVRRPAAACRTMVTSADKNRQLRAGLGLFSADHPIAESIGTSEFCGRKCSRKYMASHRSG